MRSIIIYTTKYGCTEKVALKLKSYMQGDVKLVNLMKEKAPSLEGYDRVIIGGSIYYGRIQKKLTEYMTAAQSELISKRLGLFICAASPDIDTRKQELEQSFPVELYEHAACHDILGSEVNYNKLRVLDRIIFRMVSKTKTSYSHIPEDEIQRFANVMDSIRATNE